MNNDTATKDRKPAEVSESTLNDLLSELLVFPSRLLDCVFVATAPNTSERNEFCRLILPLIGEHINNINKVKLLIEGDEEPTTTNMMYSCKSFVDGECGEMNCVHAIKHEHNFHCGHHYCKKIDRCNGGCVAR